MYPWEGALIGTRVLMRHVSCLSSVLFGLCTMALPSLNACRAATLKAPEKADYRITSISRSPLKVCVTADVPIDGSLLEMDGTYPAELPQMASGGWPSLVRNLVVRDSTGKEIRAALAGPRGWQLVDSIRSRLEISYEVDYTLFSVHGWSSPLESAFADDSTIAVVGRSIFITTQRAGTIDVEIAVQGNWLPVMPWMAREDRPNRYVVRSRQELIDNMLVFTESTPDVVTAAGFRLQVVSLGHWRPLRPLLRPVLETIISREVKLMAYKEREIFTVLLLPIADEGGNAFRQGFAYCHPHPHENNTDDWGNTLAHEIFHYWNYGKLRGADYAASQWFQEGFTEYVANLVMVTGKIVGSDAFLRRLSHHVKNYRKLTTTLENYGTHKGPPLYSAGALVAFLWDVTIIRASGGSRNIGDLFRNLMIQTDSGARTYSWADIQASLEATAQADWGGFYQSYIRGHESLPLAATFPLAGLRLKTLPDGTEHVEFDPAASAEARGVWRTLVGD